VVEQQAAGTPNGQRLEDELGEKQDMFIRGCQRDWDHLPDPAAPLIVGIDGGYVCKRPAVSRKLIRFDSLIKRRCVQLQMIS